MSVLDESQRARLDTIVVRMQNEGKSFPEIKKRVEEFKAKHGEKQKKAPSWTEAMFPRVMEKAPESGGKIKLSPEQVAGLKDTGKTKILPEQKEFFESGKMDETAPQMMAAMGLDYATATGRAIKGAVKAPFKKGEKIGETVRREMAETESTAQNPFVRFLENTAIDPATPVTLPIGGGVAGGAIRKIATQGAKEGLASAVMHLLDKYQEKGKIDKGDIIEGAAEVGLSTLMPLGLEGLSRGAKKAAIGNLWGNIKNARREISRGFDAENILKHNLEGRNLRSIHQKAIKKLEKLRDEQRNIIKEFSDDGVKIDIQSALGNTYKKFFPKGSKTPGVETFGENKPILKELKKLYKELDNTFQDKPIDLETAQTLKTKIGKLGDWQKRIISQGAAKKKLPAQAKVINEFYKNLRKEIEQSLPPRLKSINKQFEEIIPVAQTIENQLEREMGNYRVPTLNTVIGGSVGAATAGPLGLLSGLAAAQIPKTLNRPITARGLSAIAKPLGSDVTRKTVPLAGRTAFHQTDKEALRRMFEGGNDKQ